MSSRLTSNTQRQNTLAQYSYSKTILEYYPRTVMQYLLNVCIVYHCIKINSTPFLLKI